MPEFNPYAPATAVTDDTLVGPGTETPGSTETQPRTLGRTAIRWFVVCSISAMPSFLFGLAITESRIGGMVMGILIFVLGYTLLDYQTARWAVRQKRTVRRTLAIAYGTRIAISILFPVGAALDIICGAFSVGLTETIVGEHLSEQGWMSFWQALLTTLVQGMILNLVLAIYALIVHAIQVVVVALRR